MNQTFVRTALLIGFFAPLLGSLRAQDEGPPPEQYEPPPPIGVDANYFAPPKNKISIGLRMLTGPKISVSGSFGLVPSAFNPGNPNDSSITTRTYADGTVNASPGTNDFGNAVTLPAGTTNFWSFNSNSQLTTDGNQVQMHDYSAVIDGTNPQKGKSDLGTGFDLTLERDFGWHLGPVQITVIAGLSGNDIHYILTKPVPAEVTTLTDTYTMYNPVQSNGTLTLDANGNATYATDSSGNLIPAGPPPAGAPYSAPSSTVDASNQTADNSTLLDTQPNQNTDPNNPNPSRQTSTAHTTGEVTDQWHVKGAYFTIRAGPKITVPMFADKLQISVSAGPALVYAGTTFSVVQTINTPSVNSSTTVSDGYSTLLPAYFADADVEYWLTERTGFYAGAVFQASTSYGQSIASPNGAFHTNIDFGNEEGMRAGMDFKF